MNATRRATAGWAAAIALSLGACRARPPRPSQPPDAAPAARSQILVEMSFARVDRAALEALLGEPVRPGVPQQRTLSAADADAFTARVRALPAVPVRAAPTILALDGEEASVFVGETPRDDGRGLTFSVESALTGPGAHGLLARVRPRRDATGPRTSADLSFVWKDAGVAGRPEPPAMRGDFRVSLLPTERAVWYAPFPRDGGGGREHVVLVLAVRPL